MMIDASLIKAIFQKIANLENEIPAWKFVDVGRVVQNKTRGSREILVALPELLAEHNGEVAISTDTLTVDALDLDNNAETIEAKCTSAISAIWLPMCERSIIPPDVRVGERVFIYRYADNDAYYWFPTGLDSTLRRLETTLTLWSGDPDGVSNEDRTPENSYALLFSTHDKVIKLSTTNLNGEPFTYVFELNTDTGLFTITDSDENKFYFNSMETIIGFINKETTKIEINKKDIIGYAPQDALVQVDRDFIIEAGRDVNITATENFNVQSRVTNISGSESITLETQEATIDSPETTVTGNLNVIGKTTTGSFESTGKSTLGGGGEVKGDLKLEGATSSKPIKGPTQTLN